MKHKNTLQVSVPKPRNTTHRILAQCKGGKMQKTHKQLRRAQNANKNQGFDYSKPSVFMGTQVHFF